MKKILLTLAILVNLSLNAQTLSGLWKGSYTHYVPTCCDEVNYNITFKIHEDGRGALWLEVLSSPFSEEQTVGEFVAGGFKSPSGKIFIRDLKETFSTMQYSTTCFRNCRWCFKEYALDYSTKNNDEILSGIWNSKECFPGGDIKLKKIRNLTAEEWIPVMKQMQTFDKYYDPIRMGQGYPLSIYNNKDSTNQVIVNIGGGYFYSYKLNVDNPTDLVENVDKIKVQKVTAKVDKGRQFVTYFELYDTRNGKIYPVGEKPEKTMDLIVSPSGLTFPNKKEWGIILGETIDEKRNEIEIQSKLKRSVKINKNEIEVNSSQVVYAEIWDNNVEDGDIVTIFLNGKSILYNFKLSKKKEKVQLKLRKGENILIMYAENLGSIPPNTAALKLTIDEKQYNIVMESDLNKSEAIKFIVK